MVDPYSLVAQNSSHVRRMMEMVSSCSSKAALDPSLRMYNRPPFEDRPIVHVIISKDLVLRIFTMQSNITTSAEWGNRTDWTVSWRYGT